MVLGASTYMPIRGTEKLMGRSAYMLLDTASESTQESSVQALSTLGTAGDIQGARVSPVNFSPEKWVDLLGKSAKTASQTDTLVLERQLDYVRRERDELAMTLQERKLEHARHVAEAVGGDVALFILAKIAAAGRVDVAELTENLTAPYGWLAVAALWRAELVDYLGDQVLVTDAGSDVVKRLRAEISNRSREY